MNKYIFFLLAVLFSFNGCVTKNSAINYIGVVGPLTGEGATYGQAMKRGFDLAFETDSTFRLIYEDDKLDAKEGVNSINKLINSDHVQIVLGSAASSVTLAMAPVAEKNKVILFSSISTSDKLRESGDYIFRNVPRNEIQGQTAAEFLFNQLHKMKAVILYKNDEYGTNLSRSFKTRFIELGGSILYEDSYLPQTNDFRSVIAKIKALHTDAIFSPGNYQETALLIRQSVENKMNIIIIGGDGSYSPELINIAGKSAEGAYFTLMTVNKENNYYMNFYNKFINKFKRDPDVYDAYAYEAGLIVLEAIHRVGYNADSIKHYLYSTTFSSMTGNLVFDKDGEVQRNYGIVKVKDQKFVDVKKQ